MRAVQSKSGIDRKQLQQIIADLSEGVLLIDPDGTILWANRAALVMHGCERLEQLGLSAPAYRKRFVLHYLNHHALKAHQYPVVRALAGEKFDNVKVEVTRRDDDDFSRVLEFRSLVLAGAADEIELLVLVVRDVTELMSAEERFERTFAANPAPAVILRLTGARYIKVNQGFIDMTGFGREEIVGRSFRELDVLREAEHREEAMHAMREHRTITQQEAVLRISDNTEKFVIVAGQPIEIGDEACMLFTFNDLDARKQAEMSLRHSEERFAKAFRLAPVPMLVCARGGWRIIEINDAFANVTGYPHADAVGRSVADVGFWVDMRSLRELRGLLDANLKVRSQEIRMHTRDGASIDCLLSAEPVTIQREACVLFVVRDITERKRSEADLMDAIEAVMQDTSWFSRTVMEKLAQLRHPEDASAKAELATLTAREREVLDLICKGQTDAEIASALKLSRNTVRNHVATLYGKIGVNRRSAAVVWGRERGLAAY